VRGDHSLNEVKTGKLPACARLALRDRRRDPCRLRLRPGLPRADRPGGAEGAAIKVVADRTVAAMSDFVCGANVADHPLHRRELGARPARARSRRRHPQRASRAILARRQGQARDPARIEVGHVFLLGD
jgi:prolyl-tRNA synthetase